MIENLPLYVSVFFGLTTIGTLWIFYRILKNSENLAASLKASYILIGLALWLVLQGVLSLNHIYSLRTDSFPPKIVVFGILPALLAILLVFLSPSGRRFIDGLSLSKLTWLNVIRIPVEITLYWLFLYQSVPELMTFTGRNFDILAGITAPFMAWYYSRSTGKKSARNWLLVWNFIALALLINIVVIAFFSAPSPVQKFAFEQPNIAILYFPISWLPTFIVPVVLFSHLAAIRQLLYK